MSALRYTIMVGWAAALLSAGCAVSPEDESRRDAMEADIAAILSIQLDPNEFGTTKRCLSDLDFRKGPFRSWNDFESFVDHRLHINGYSTLRSRAHCLHGKSPAMGEKIEHISPFAQTTNQGVLLSLI